MRHLFTLGDWALRQVYSDMEGSAHQRLPGHYHFWGHHRYPANRLDRPWHGRLDQALRCLLERYIEGGVTELSDVVGRVERRYLDIGAALLAVGRASVGR